MADRPNLVLMAGLASAVILVGLTWGLAPARFSGAWLAAVTWFAGWPLGSLGLLLIHSLTGGRWGDLLRPALVVGIEAMALLVLLALLLAIEANRLYPWLVTGAGDKSFYLNGPFLAARTAFYLIVWCGLGGLTLRTLRISTSTAFSLFAPLGLVLLALTITFAAIDSGMALDLGFNSSVYGLLTMAGQALLALSVAVAVTALMVEPDPEVTAELGRLMLGLAIFWTYLDFVQFLIVWESDLTQEVPWYLERGRGVWGCIAGLVVVGNSVLPFTLLLSGTAKRSRRVVVSAALFVVAAELLRSWWLILPSLHRTPDWPDIATMLALGGAAVAWLVFRTTGITAGALAVGKP